MPVVRTTDNRRQNTEETCDDVTTIRRRLLSVLCGLRLAGLVVIARSLNPIPFRTRPLNFSAPMILRLKTRESRSLPGLPSADDRRQRTDDGSTHRPAVCRPLSSVSSSLLFAQSDANNAALRGGVFVLAGSAARGGGRKPIEGTREGYLAVVATLRSSVRPPLAATTSQPAGTGQAGSPPKSSSRFSA
jgi:hypothetical protein